VWWRRPSPSWLLSWFQRIQTDEARFTQVILNQIAVLTREINRRSAGGRPPRRNSPWTQNLVASEGIAKGRAKKHIRREMRPIGYAGKADRRREAVYRPWHPAMRVVARGNDRGYGKSTRGVPGWETASFKR
jgi:hypothetical protein